MTRRELIKYCLTFPAAYEDYPFDPVKDGTEWCVLRHRANRKSFAMIYERLGALHINLKCDPMEADFLRQLYSSVTPGYHMNHEHWNTVTLGDDCDVPMDELRRQIGNSYELIKPKRSAGM
ncbi:MAG: MmcQ/YjbR family DNA-binding protein [Oscillospiraceae bacterium]|jgi:predicted DNA-binding protein (MmcQ/YjbR family)|nr:MmcQ/YjbR family DNA-binding protein [Oscillospiraceae bacterium]